MYPTLAEALISYLLALEVFANLLDRLHNAVFEEEDRPDLDELEDH